MIVSLALAFAGLILIFVEFFVPGGIVGALGAILLLASFLLFAHEDPGVFWVVIYGVGLIALVVFLIKFALSRIKKSSGDRSIYHSDDQEGYMASSFDKDLIGKRGEVLSDLKPSGRVLIEGQPYQALSRMNYVEKGTPVEVIGGQGAHLIVKKVS